MKYLLCFFFLFSFPSFAKEKLVVQNGDSLLLEVPDPGDEGLKTLAGIDRDKDGVRDDIQRWINENYSQRESMKKGLKQMAVSMNLSLLNANNKEVSNRYSHEIERSMACLIWISDYGLNQEKIMRVRFYNTAERIKAKMQADSNFHGENTDPEVKKLSSSEWNQLCKFSAIKEN